METLQAQVVVSGRVTAAEDGIPLVGASATLKNTFTGDQAKQDGYFAMPNVPKGSYTLVVSYLGYETIEKNIEVGETDVFFKIKLTRKPIVSDELVVYGTRANENTPTTYTNLAKKEIEKLNFGQDMPYLLEFTPSAVVNSDAGNGIGYTGIRIRGTDVTRINVTINGVPLNDAESQGVFWVNLPDLASSTENIQVQRGVGTSTNGAGAFGASINVLTNQLNPDFYAELNNTVGSFGTVKNTLRIGSGLVNDRFTFDGRVSRLVSDGYVDRASSDLFSFYLSGGFYTQNQSLRLNVFHGQEETYQAWYGVTRTLMDSLGRTYNPAGTERPNAPYDNQVDDYQQTHYQLVYNHQLQTNLNFSATAHYTRGFGYYEEYEAQEPTSFYNILPNINTDLVRQRWLDNHFYGLVYAVNYFTPDGLMEATLGGGWNNYDGLHFGDVIWTDSAITNSLPHRYYESEANKRDFNIYGKANYQFTSRLNGFLDLQYRRLDYSFEGIDEDGSPLSQDVNFNFFNPKAGLTFEFDPTSKAYAYFGVANKEPNRNDFVDNPPTQQPQHETLYDWELGYRKTLNNAVVNLNAFYMLYDNQLVLTGELNDVGAYIRTNVDRSYRMGIEADVRWNIANAWDWNVNLAVSRHRIAAHTEYLDDYGADFNYLGQRTLEHENTPLPLSPDVLIGSELTHQLFAKYPQFNKNNQLNASWLARWVGKQYVDNAQARSIQPYMTNDFRLTYARKFSGRGGQRKGIFKQADVNILVRNIFNVLYEPNAWSYRYYYDGSLSQDVGLYPQAGTNFLVSVNLSF